MTLLTPDEDAIAPVPTRGQRVLYRLTAQDVTVIDQHRPAVGPDGRTMRNAVKAGDVRPADVVETFGGTAANLIVLLDGYGTYWATSRAPGNEPGQWWPLTT